MGCGPSLKSVSLPSAVIDSLSHSLNLSLHILPYNNHYHAIAVDPTQNAPQEPQKIPPPPPVIPVFYGDEDLAEYTVGGYHPVHLGDRLHSRYVVVSRLGSGHFSTVWMCFDIRSQAFKRRSHSSSGSKNKYVAIKIQKSAAAYEEAACEEIELLLRVATIAERARQQNIAILLDHFVHLGPHGTHMCMVFEAYGENLLQVIGRYNSHGIPIKIVKNFARHILQGLHFLHTSCGIIHTDLKPENILIGEPPRAPDFKAMQSMVDLNVSGGYDPSQLIQMETMSSSDGSINEEGDEEEEAGNGDDVDEVLLPHQPRARTLLRLRRATTGSSSVQPLSTVGDEGDDFSDAEHQPAPALSLGALNAVYREAVVKIVDLGNSCYIDEAGLEIIQTREYRCPEVIMGLSYTTSADMWSFACILFELMTGRVLFDPHERQFWSRDEDHLAMMGEVLGGFPIHMTRRAPQFFNKQGQLRRVGASLLATTPLVALLMQKHRMETKEATEIADFLTCIFQIDPRERLTAQDCLHHDWLLRS